MHRFCSRDYKVKESTFCAYFIILFKNLFVFWLTCASGSSLQKFCIYYGLTSAKARNAEPSSIIGKKPTHRIIIPYTIGKHLPFTGFLTKHIPATATIKMTIEKKTSSNMTWFWMAVKAKCCFWSPPFLEPPPFPEPLYRSLPYLLLPSPLPSNYSISLMKLIPVAISTKSIITSIPQVIINIV